MPQNLYPERLSDSDNLETLVAYCLVAHSDPDHFGKLVERLAHPNVKIFVHIDQKSDLGLFRAAAAGTPGVTFCEERVNVVWAAFSQIEATSRLIALALDATSQRCQRFVLLSGADYPLTDPATLVKLLTIEPRRQYIRAFAIDHADAHQRNKIHARHFREFATRNSWKRRPLFVFERGLRMILPPPKLPDITFVSGSNWWGLTRDCVAYCLAKSRDREFCAPFRLMFGPDEIFFHTVIYNSQFAANLEIEPYIDTRPDGFPAAYWNLHYLTRLEIETAEQASIALRHAPRCLFARKFSSARSAAAIAEIDRAIDWNVQATTKSSDPLAIA